MHYALELSITNGLLVIVIIKDSGAIRPNIRNESRTRVSTEQQKKYLQDLTMQLRTATTTDMKAGYVSKDVLSTSKESRNTIHSRSLPTH